MAGKQQTTITLDKKLHTRAKTYCVKNDTNVSKLISELLDDFMKGKRVN